jgi:Uma2 family endonuclease
MLARQPELTYSEYLAYEQASPKKHEFVNGQAYAMAGASEDHNLLVGGLFSRIWNHLRGSNCRVFSSDMKLTIASANNATYYP